MSLVDALPDFSQLLSAPGIMGVIIGAVGMRLVEWGLAKRLDREEPEDAPHTVEFNPVYLIWLIVAVAISTIAVKTEEAWDCVRLQAKTISTNQQLIIRESNAEANWLQTLLAPPPPFKDLPQDDPTRQAWAISVTIDYQKVVEQVRKEREANEAIRKANAQCLG